MNLCKKFSAPLEQVAEVARILCEELRSGGAGGAGGGGAGGQREGGRGGDEAASSCAGAADGGGGADLSPISASPVAPAVGGLSPISASPVGVAHRIISLEGTLGAGKTTLARALLAALGADGGSSPTYLKMFEYSLAPGNALAPITSAFHYDFYAQMSPDLAMAFEENLLLPGLHITEWLPEGLLARLKAYGLGVWRVRITPANKLREYEIFRP